MSNEPLTAEEYDRALFGVFETMTHSAIWSIEGVYEAVKEELNNAAIDAALEARSELLRRSEPLDEGKVEDPAEFVNPEDADAAGSEFTLGRVSQGEGW